MTAGTRGIDCAFIARGLVAVVVVVFVGEGLEGDVGEEEVVLDCDWGGARREGEGDISRAGLTVGGGD